MTRARPFLARLLAAAALGAAAAPAARAAAAPGGDDAVRLPAVVVVAAERSIITVSVPIPDALRGAEEVEYVVRPLNGASIVGGGRARISPRRIPSGMVVVTLRVPHDVAAGRLDIADLEFRGADGALLVQPVSVSIPLRRGLMLDGPAAVDALRADDRVDLTFRIRNDGNAPESLTVAVRPPRGWSVLPAEARVVVVPRGGSMEVEALVGVPSRVGIGDYLVALEVTPHVRLAEGPAALVHRTAFRVRDNGTTVPGLTVTPTVAAATSSDGGQAFVGATISGPVNETVSVRARILPRFRQAGIIAQGLGRIGAFTAPFAASVSGRDWNVDVGNALVQLSPLTGVNIIGEGVTASGARGGWSGRAVAGRPAANLGATGTIAGAGAWRDIAAGRIGGSASYLREQGGLARGRQLTAVATDFESRPIGTLTLSSGLAWRASDVASGVGYAFGVQHDRPGERASVRVTHAPGGSAAFARAADELELQAGRAITDRWSMDATVARSRDRSNVFSAVENASWSVMQRYAFTGDRTFTFRASRSEFDARSARGDFGGFGAGTRDYAAGYEHRLGGLSLSLEASAGVAARRSELLAGRVVESEAGQRGARLFAARDLDRLGTVDLSTSFLATDAGIGAARTAWYSSARWSGLPLASGRVPVRMDAELQQQSIGGLRSFVIARSAVSTTLPGGYEVAMLVERNPYFRDAAGRPAWIAALRVSAARMVREPSASGDLGFVYADHNANGRRDAGEPGIPGVSVRRGEYRVTTDRNGRYRMPARARGRVRVDQASLPAGLLAHPLVSADSLERLDLPLLETGTTELALRLQADDEGRVPAVRLREARVLLQDATGFEWVGRHVDDSTVVFQDIPAGTYRPRLDLSGVGEPLRWDESITVTVIPKARRTVVIPLRGRALRLTIPPVRGDRGDRGGRGSDRTAGRGGVDLGLPPNGGH